MASTVANVDARMPVKKDHTDSHADRLDRLPVHSGSQPLRIDPKQEFLEILNETRTRLGLSIEAMAAVSGVAKSAMSDALAGKRNFAGHWVTAQGQEFEAMFARVLNQRRGLTPEAKRAVVARQFGEFARRFIEHLEEIA